jgi:hypothetical protein
MIVAHYMLDLGYVYQQNTPVYLQLTPWNLQYGRGFQAE